MKKRLITGSLASGTFFTASVLAAGGATGIGSGGVGYVCRDASGVIQKAFLLDLLEAEAEGRTIDEAARLSTATERFPSVQLQKRFQEEYERVYSATKKTDAKFALPDTNDYVPRVSLKGCNLETIGFYDDEKEELRTDSEILAALPPVHQEAFYAHETIYKIARKQGIKDSDQVRPLVGELFSKYSSQEQKYLLRSQFLQEEALAPCAIYVESVELQRATQIYGGLHTIVFHLRTDSPADPVIEAGYVSLQHHGGPAEWETVAATSSDSNTWHVGISIPAQFNYSWAEVAFFARTSQGHTYWLNEDGVSGRNFGVDFTLFYVIDGFSREKPSPIISTSTGPEPELIRQFNPARCEK